MYEDIGFLDGGYRDISNSKHRNEYYNPLNIYHRLGYWPGEIYRFGVVYILEDFTFTPVFNISGGDFTTLGELGRTDDLFENNIRKFINVNERIIIETAPNTMRSKSDISAFEDTKNVSKPTAILNKGITRVINISCFWIWLNEFLKRL